jgi:hypothetical protein
MLNQLLHIMNTECEMLLTGVLCALRVGYTLRSAM